MRLLQTQKKPGRYTEQTFNHFSFKASGSNIALLLLVLVVATRQHLYAQACSAEPDPTTLPGGGCTNFYNSGWNSTSDASSIEYDNFVSSFHSTAVRLSDGSFKIWGESTQPNGTSSFLSPTAINTTNFPTMSGTPYKVGMAGNQQMVLLTSDGLFAWGKAGEIFGTSVKSTTAFQKLTTTHIVNANSYGLPVTITPSQVKQMLAVPGALSILTCTGEVYIVSKVGAIIGSDDTYADNKWFRVETASTTFLSDVIALRGSIAGFMALKSDGTLWTWGRGTYLGDGTATTSRTFATLMTLPSTTSTIKMIAVSGVATFSAPSRITYYVLYADGNLYSLGSNTNKAIGDWTTTSRLTWVQPRYTSASGPVMNDIKWISVNEGGTNSSINNLYQTVNVINNSKNVYAWGEDNNGMIGLGGGTISFTRDPGIPAGLATTDKIIQVESGGHTTMVIRECTNNFGYVGHRINGSMGDGSTTDFYEPSYTFSTSSIDVIGASPINFTTSSPTFNSSCAICTSTPLTFVGDPSGGTFSIAAGGTGTGTITSAGVLTATAPGTINVTYTGPSGTCPASLTKTYTFGNCAPAPAPPIANNITAPLMNNSQGATAIPQLVASSPSGIPIESYTITTLPPSTQGILYYCTSTTVPCPSGSLATVTTSTVLTPAQAQNLYFDPAPGFMGNATFSYTAKDTNDMVSNSANYIIPVRNDPPVTSNIVTAQMLDTNHSTPLPSLIAADKDGTIASYTVSGIPPASQGVLTYCSTGDEPCTGTVTTITGTTTLTPAQMATLKLDPTAGFTGTYTFNYKATDNNGNQSNVSSVSTPIVSTLGGNLPPVANNISAQNISNAAGATPIPKLLGSDPDGNVASYTIGSSVPNPTTEGTLTYCTTPPSSGCGTPVLAGQTMSPAQAATLSFDPVSSFVGNAVFTYTATDDAGVPLTSAPATYTIPVVNTPPVANPDKVSPIVNTLTTPTLLPPLSGSDVEGPIATYNITTVPPSSQGTLQYCATAPGTPCTAATLTTISVPISGLTPDQVATLHFIPNSSFTGDYVFEFTTVDVNGSVSQPASVTVPVTATSSTVGQPPIANSYNATPISSSATANLSSALNGNDPDGTISKYTITSVVPAHEGVLTYCVTPPSTGCGTPLTVGLDLTPAQAASILFTPNIDFNGTSTFTYTATDNSGNLSNTGTVTIPVVNQPPLAQDVSNPAVSRSAGATALFPLSSTDPDGTVVSYTIQSLPTADQGELRVCTLAPGTGCTPVTLGQVLTPAQMAQLSFTPNPSTTSPVVNFLYSTTDNAGNLSNLATVAIPMLDALSLPLEFLSATVQVQDCAVNLQWRFNEVAAPSVQYFGVERSADGRDFVRIATLTNEARTYRDEPAGTTVWYYRILAEGSNNRIVYTPTLQADNGDCSSNTIRVFPNPTADFVTIQVRGTMEEGRFVLTDMFGKTVSSGELSAQENHRIDIARLPSGIYQMKVLGSGQVQVVQLTIVH